MPESKRINLPRPPHKKKMVAVELDEALHTAAQKEWKKAGLSGRQVMEWGIKVWLLNVNPMLAQTLGVHPEERA